MTMPLIPSFAFDVEASAAGADDATDRLGAFAGEHGVGAAVRDRLTSLARAVVTGLARADGGAGRIVVEADIDQGDLQVVFTRQLSSRESAEEARRGLERLRGSCDGFSTQRTDDARLEVWVCFLLRRE